VGTRQKAEGRRQKAEGKKDFSRKGVIKADLVSGGVRSGSLQDQSKRFALIGILLNSEGFTLYAQPCPTPTATIREYRDYLRRMSHGT